eukprot:scaffold52962_cov54-Attheya_sp.AAC.3
MYPLRNVLFWLVAWGSFVSTGTSEDIDERRRDVNPKPCVDIAPECPRWAKNDECRKALEYMSANCPMSCDICNPSLTLSSGVPQRTNFSDYFQSSAPPNNDLKEQQERLIAHMERRVRFVLKAMDLYLSQPRDAERLVPETCRNRHPHCALWASKGYCDSKRPSMRETCPAVCHMCHSFPDDAAYSRLSPEDKVSTQQRPHLESTTAFQRLDLDGVFEAIEEDRVVIAPSSQSGIPPNGVLMEPQHTSTWITDESSNVDQIFILPLGQIKTFVFRLKPGSESAMAASRDRNDLKLHSNTGASHFNAPDRLDESSPHIVQFDRFLSVDDCRLLLDMMQDDNNAGFAPPTFDTRVLADGTPVLHRTSSRSFYPRPKSGFPPVLERVLSKIEMVTSVPAAQHVEFPIRFDQFESGHFQKAYSHFVDPFADSHAKSRGDSNEHEGEEVLNRSTGVGNPNFHLIRNARIMGITFFLSDVDSGGEIIFPKMGNFTVHPKMGRAILYPTVISLIGERPDGTVSEDDDKTQHASEGGYLIEDTSTILSHEPVISGTKDTLTIFLRRFPNERN